MSTQTKQALVWIFLGGIVGFSIGQWGFEIVFKWGTLMILIVSLLPAGYIAWQPKWGNAGLFLIIVICSLIFAWLAHYVEPKYLEGQSDMLILMNFFVPPPKKKLWISTWLREPLNMTCCVAGSLLVTLLFLVKGETFLAIACPTATSMLSWYVGWYPGEQLDGVTSGMNILLGGLGTFIGIIMLVYWALGGVS